jgi:hydroxyacyl-ACP dehydratase HTD2-like protein with hotdog domain
MRTVAALLQDPYPPHYDRRRAAELDYPGLLNQGPANVSYILEAIVQELETPTDLHSFETRFYEGAFEDETVTVTATVTETTTAGDAHVITFAVELVKPDDTVAVDGTVTAEFAG